MTIRQEQCLLTYLGYDPGEIDGVDGPKTRRALSAFSGDYGVGADGLVGAVAGTVPRVRKEEDFWTEIPNFSREEFRCKCGGQFCGGFQHEPQETMVRIAQKVRSHFDAPVHIISGLRCPEWNRRQGGKENSQHIYGEAADIWVSGVDWETVLDYVQSLPEVRFAYHIDGSSNVHFDLPKGAR